MVIVQGVFRIDPADRDAYLAQSVDAMKGSRAEKGCLEYVFAADPVESDRVVLSERWASMDDLNEHLAGTTQRRSESSGAATPTIAADPQEIVIYEISSSRALR
jgi:quinol monooxygenase YgiN